MSVQTADMPLRVITFDLDDTLWAVEPALVAADRNARAWLQQHAPDMATGFNSAALQAIRTELVTSDPSLLHQLSRIRRDTYFVALQRTGYSDAEASRLADSAFKVFLDGRHAVQPFSGVPELLAELARDYVLGALSNGNADLQRIAIGEHFNFQFSAEQVGAAKPHRAMFDAAMRHCDASPDSMLHVGDNAEHDVLGAANAGVRCIWVNAVGRQFPTDLGVTPAAEISSVLELRALLAGWR